MALILGVLTVGPRPARAAYFGHRRQFSQRRARGIERVFRWARVTFTQSALRLGVQVSHGHGPSDFKEHVGAPAVQDRSLERDGAQAAR
jgi:hypothetical protein